MSWVAPESVCPCYGKGKLLASMVRSRAVTGAHRGFSCPEDHTVQRENAKGREAWRLPLHRQGMSVAFRVSKAQVFYVFSWDCKAL